MTAMHSREIKTQVLVLGGGPGGYSAAFRAADLGLSVVLVEQDPVLGGVCLNKGCIPSKTLLHLAATLDATEAAFKKGLEFSKPVINLKAIREHKNQVIRKLTDGLAGLARQRKVQVIAGRGEFENPHCLRIVNPADPHEHSGSVQFEHAIIAVGSEPMGLPFLPQNDPRVWDSTSALALQTIPKRLLVMGAGIIGMEMATVYQALGSEITVVEWADMILPGADPDLVQPLYKRIASKCRQILLKTKVVALEAKDDGLYAQFEGPVVQEDNRCFDAVLCAVGRRPNGQQIKAEAAGILVDQKGFIPVDKQQRTNVSHIFAVGDVVGNPMLAHKAIPEGRIAAEVIAGRPHYFEPQCIPSVVYTDPEVAWVGLTEQEAKHNNIAYEKGVFPWAASGRALSMDRSEGFTKMLYDPKSHRLLGVGIVGVHAGDLIGEAALALELGCEAEDLSLTIHPHPTLSETLPLATEVFEGTVTDLYCPKK